jgi:hypothetical protein
LTPPRAPEPVLPEETTVASVIYRLQEEFVEAVERLMGLMDE